MIRTMTKAPRHRDAIREARRQLGRVCRKIQSLQAQTYRTAADAHRLYTLTDTRIELELALQWRLRS